ncbi:MAG: FGGY family carbohydrate kinase [Spirochaetia bacterium]
MHPEKAARVEAPLSLGIDLSTQSITGVLVDPTDGKVVYEHSLSYTADTRLDGFGIDHQSFIIPPRRHGEADQPPALFLTALEALLEDMQGEAVPMQRIAVINLSAQQHGHVYLNRNFEAALQALKSSEKAPQPIGRLAHLMGDIFSYQTAPIWMTSDTGEEADHIRTAVGGKADMIQLSGSDSPLRFTGAVVRRVGRHYPEEYRRTARILLLNTFVAAVLSGRVDVACDFGNACGTSLLNYRKKQWDQNLIRVAAMGLPEGATGLLQKLPALTEPYAAVGTIAAYFQDRFGLAAECRIAAGSGDNPQTKVLIPQNLLSLGTSFVHMVSNDSPVVDENGFANSMYDGLGRPFMFGCRTNGALVWDRIRSMYNLKKNEYDPAEKALSESPAGSSLLLYQPYQESFPVSPEIPLQRYEGSPADLGHDYSGIIDSSLALLYYYSSNFSGGSRSQGGSYTQGDQAARGSVKGSTAEPERLYITGGPAGSPEILKRIAGLWNCEVVTIGSIGAALGAAAAGIKTLSEAGYPLNPETSIEQLLTIETKVVPDPVYVQAYHGEGGYLRRLISIFENRNRIE